MTRKERLARTQEVIKSLEQRNTRKDEHRIRLYREITRRRLGEEVPYASPEIAFKFLSCGALYIRMRCSRDANHYQLVLPWQYCGLRFFCDCCAAYERKRRAQEWFRLIKWVTSASHVYPLQMVKLEWPLPDLKDVRNLSRFSDYLHRVWRPALATQGIPPTRWMLPVAVNPITGTIRGLYLGSRIAPVVRMDCGKKADAPLVRMKREIAFVAPVVPSGVLLLATSGAWRPRLVASVDLPGECNPCYWAPLLPALEWVTESCLEPSDLEPATAVEIDRIYYRRRLYSVHGALYGARGIVKLDPEPEAIRTAKAYEFHDRCPKCGGGLEMTCETR